MNTKVRWGVGVGLGALLLAFGIWRMAPGSPAVLALLRLYTDHVFLHERLRALGWLAPVAFVLLQALQVVVSPIPGEATGFLGGYLFGVTRGFAYSTVGLALGTMAAFAIGRWLGAAVVRRYASNRVVERFGFVLKAEGAMLALVIYLIPGFPKDIVSYLFGMSPMPAAVFLLVSTLGRMPGTWVLSAQGASTATGQYVQLVLVTSVAAAVIIPLYYYRHRILNRLRRSGRRGGQGRRPEKPPVGALARPGGAATDRDPRATRGRIR
jgi:uncharacterized membrane protein YdjX (TVP38/TMEM64 family)